MDRIFLSTSRCDVCYFGIHQCAGQIKQQQQPEKKRLVVFHCSSHNSKPDPTVETLGSVYKQNEMDKRKNERKNDFYVFNEISALI